MLQRIKEERPFDFQSDPLYQICEAERIFFRDEFHQTLGIHPAANTFMALQLDLARNAETQVCDGNVELHPALGIHLAAQREVTSKSTGIVFGSFSKLLDDGNLYHHASILWHRTNHGGNFRVVMMKSPLHPATTGDASPREIHNFGLADFVRWKNNSPETIARALKRPVWKTWHGFTVIVKADVA